MRTGQVFLLSLALIVSTGLASAAYVLANRYEMIGMASGNNVAWKIDRLTGQVRALGVSSLSTRIAVPAPPLEIAVVVEQVNALLARLEAGFERERQMSSDIAHELKTPIGELRNLSEVGARWPEDRQAVRQFFEDAKAIAQHMERVVAHLLALARYDEGRERVWTAPVQVAEIVDGAWKPLAREAAAAISVRLGGTGTATAAQPSLAQALTNSSLAASEPAP
jgi:two-component system sensor histidine kinase QseC